MSKAQGKYDFSVHHHFNIGLVDLKVQYFATKKWHVMILV